MNDKEDDTRPSTETSRTTEGLPTQAEGDLASAQQEDGRRPSHIVGIGASAGGLEALQTLFDHMPHDLGVAYVIVQHLSPDFKSLMDELLAKHTKMPTREAAEGELLEPDNVYLIPSGKLMRIAEGRLYLSDLPPDQRINLPINELFRTLAEDAQNRAVAIILSGTGSDGSRGILALKEAGGMVIVQDPKDAQFDGMLINAINTGRVDFILPTEEMPEQIASFVFHPLATTEANSFREHLSENSAVLADIFRIVEEKTALDFRFYKESTVARRIEHRMSINRLKSLEEYRDFLDSDKEEPSLMQQDLLIGVTQFFRDTDIWEALERSVIRKIVKNAAINETIRVWCTGCSTGEEAYSLAMAFSEELKRQRKTCFLKVFGSDIDTAAVGFAAAGVYPAGISSEIPAHLLDEYFSELADGSYQVSESLRGLVVFASQNLIQDPPFSNMHLVSCRNTLIYLQTEAQRKAIAFFHFALRLQGYLFLGSAESVGTFSEYFEVVDARNRIYQKVNEIRIPVSSISNTPKFGSQPGTALKRQPRTLSKGAMSTPKRATKRRTIGADALMQEYLPPSLVIDSQMQIVHAYGDTEAFLIKPRTGVVSTDVAALVHPDLVGSLISAVQRSSASGESSRLVDVYFSADGPNGALESWTLETRRFVDDDLDKEFFAVSFLAPRPKTDAVPADEGVDAVVITDQARELNRALVESQNAYRSVLEELDSTSEQLQASNEELMAANEELQSTNEELQSVNEELYSVNSEHQQKISELIDTNDDLNNLLKATHLAVLFLTPSLEIRRFTDSVKNYINVLDVDTGRPISDLTFKYDFARLVETVKRVNQSAQGEYLTYEVGGEEGNTLVEVSIAPYDRRHTGGEPSGTIVSFLTTTRQHS